MMSGILVVSGRIKNSDAITDAGKFSSMKDEKKLTRISHELFDCKRNYMILCIDEKSGLDLFL